MHLADRRRLFEIPDEIAYLNCAYMSPLPRSVREAGVRAMARKSHPWEISPADFFGETELARDLFAELIGGDRDGVALVPSASYGIGIAAANLPVPPDGRILVLDEQFPSNLYPWRALAERTGATVATVPRPADHDWTAATLALVDDRASIIAVPNCHWTDGGLLDLVRIGTRAREVGAALVIDATQSLGAFPLDVGAVRPDFLVAVTYKWLLGPYSVGFLYAGPRHRAGLPLEYGWCNRAASEDFSRLVEYRDEYQAGARRYDVGERANFALLPMAIEALRLIRSLGVASIAEEIGALTASVDRLAAERGMVARPSALRAPHMTGIALPAEHAGAVAQHMAAAGVHVSVRGRMLRVSPHIYNTERDVQRLFEALDAVR